MADAETASLEDLPAQRDPVSMFVPPGESDAVSTFVEEEAIDREQLETIKARTMYQMVEELEGSHGATRKVLFLTNAQADLLASGSASLQKMLDVLELPKPKLVIQLFMSQGLGRWCMVSDRTVMMASEAAGVVKHRAPFVDGESERAAEERLDRFMSDVLIPLAAQTNAVILCTLPSMCALSASLTKMYAVQSARWGGKPPFSIISCSCNMLDLYCNSALDAHWRVVRKGSKTWRQRDKKILELCHRSERAGADGKLRFFGHDLDANAMNFLLCDSIDTKRDVIDDKRPFVRLMNELVRHLASTLPSLAIKTGNAAKPKLGVTFTSGLSTAMDSALSGVPTLFLDIRERALLQAADRTELIARGQEEHNAHCDALLAAGVAENLDCCTIAYFHDVLKGDGYALTTEGVDCMTPPTIAGSSALVPLHEAIRRAQEGHAGVMKPGGGLLTEATSVQISETAAWITDRTFRDAFDVLPDKAERLARGETYETLYKDQIQAHTVFTRTILASSNFHHANLADMDGARRLVGQLVRLDRLPKANSLEGLMLLRTAWRRYDVAVELSRKYKLISKLLFLAQLAISWGVVFTSTLSSVSAGADSSSAVSTWGGGGLTPDVQLILVEVVFGLSVAASTLISLRGVFNAQPRWRQLRSAAGSLESIIWCYRTRIGAFELSPTHPDSTQPEAVLCAKINEWIDDVTAGADLNSSSLLKDYAPRVYQHQQDENCNASATFQMGGDDHYSPTQPSRYIELRLQPTINFYKKRLPIYVRKRFCLEVLLLAFAVAASVLARYGQVPWVVAVTSAAAAVTAWVEFSDIGRKIERYNTTVRSLEKLLTWWSSLGEVEKAGAGTISFLISSGESIISDERLAWVSTSASNLRSEEAAPNGETEGASGGGEEQRGHGNRSRRNQVRPTTE